MNIETLMNRIDRDLDGDLPPDEARELHDFLERHPEWKRYADSLRRIEAAARAAPLIHPSPGFADRVMDRIARESQAAGLDRTGADATRKRSETGQRGLRISAWWIAAAAVVAMAVSLAAGAFNTASAFSIEDTSSAAMGAVESLGVGIAAVFEAPDDALNDALALGAGNGWTLALALLAAAAAGAANYLYGRKLRHA